MSRQIVESTMVKAADAIVAVECPETRVSKLLDDAVSPSYELDQAE